MIRAVEHIYNLSVRIGKRGTATEGEYKARDYIKANLENMGIETHVEPFKTITSFSYPYIIIYLTGVIGVIFLLFNHPVVAIILTGISAITFFLENSSFELVSLLLPKRESSNVIGYLPAKKHTEHRIIISAHYDSSRSGIMFSPRFVKGFRNTFIGLVISIFSIFILTSMYWISNVFWLKILIVILTIDPVVTIILLLHREIKGEYTNGANDNASGVGILLNLAEQFKQKPLDNTELYFVATGAEEVGMVGMIDFVKHHQRILKDAFIVNLDNCGAGHLSYIIEEGMIKKYPADHRLVTIADRLRNKGFEEVKPEVFTTMSTDALVPLARGFSAMSIMAFDEQGILPNWHWITDVYENIEPETVNLAFEFTHALIREVDAKS
ncbi:MAG: M28 family peptidase [bacterium]